MSDLNLKHPMPKTQLQAISTRQEVEELVKVAANDSHDVVFPSHLVRKDGEIVGYAGIFSTPILMWWLDSEKGKARDSIEMMREIEKLALSSGVKRYTTICSEDSPYFRHMGKLGFRELGKTVMFVKEIA